MPRTPEIQLVPIENPHRSSITPDMTKPAVARFALDDLNHGVRTGLSVGELPGTGGGTVMGRLMLSAFRIRSDWYNLPEPRVDHPNIPKIAERLSATLGMSMLFSRLGIAPPLHGSRTPRVYDEIMGVPVIHAPHDLRLQSSTRTNLIGTSYPRDRRARPMPAGVEQWYDGHFVMVRATRAEPSDIAQAEMTERGLARIFGSTHVTLTAYRREASDMPRHLHGI